MRFFPTGVALVTCGCGAGTEAITANAVTSISLEPPLILICVTSGGRIRCCIEQRGGFAVNFLAEDQAELAAVFGSRDRPRGRAAMEAIGGRVGVTGNALVMGSIAGVECDVVEQYPAGDHVLFLGRAAAIDVDGADRSPLLFHRGRYTTISTLEPMWTVEGRSGDARSQSMVHHSNR